jgi:hypothetical protein
MDFLASIKLISSSNLHTVTLLSFQMEFSKKSGSSNNVCDLYLGGAQFKSGQDIGYPEDFHSIPKSLPANVQKLH